jgi:hypothetical protein
VNHDVTVNDSTVAVLATLRQLRSSGAAFINHGGKTLSAAGSFVLTLISLCFLGLGALTLKVNQFSSNRPAFGVRKEAA